eukprot:TRINITY_DN110937_c0_g1_i1.p1 TRINITY_DN110937_c0_g1~~TRINITY_DN110937_c0_g1_i1.p1  ORF type:complete len:383 (+),score=81.39 TRINITY_DN110937_c0_g1_i1:153-1301(+)
MREAAAEGSSSPSRWSIDGLLRGSKSIHLPLGVAGSAATLLCFTAARAATMLLMALCRQGHSGFPFLFETLLVFPFFMQCVFYTTQTLLNHGLGKGFSLIFLSIENMAPCLVYSLCMSASPILETYAMQFLNPSMCVVMKQLVLVVVAVGEALVFGERQSRMAWGLILGMVGFVALFQQVGASNSTKSEASNLAKGLVPALLATVIGGSGGILQQLFMQRQAQNVPISVKLLYQHIIALICVPALIWRDEEAHHRVMTDGFFAGWNSWTYLTSGCMWLWFLTASMVTSHISAMAGCFASAVSVVLTGALEVLFLGHHINFVQFALMVIICLTAVVYTQVRIDSKSQKPAEEETKKTESGIKYRPRLKEGRREVERRGDSDSD